MIRLFALLFVGYVAADPMLISVQNQPDDDGYPVQSGRPVYSSFYPSGYAAPYGYYAPQVRYVEPSQAQFAPPDYYPRHQAYLVPHQQPMGVMQQIQQQPVQGAGVLVPNTAVLQQQQPIGTVQNQPTGPTQIFKPGPSPPMVVNPAPVVVRPPPPPPIYIQPQKIFVQPPQVPPVYASNPQVYYAQQNCPNCQPQGGAGQAVPLMPNRKK